LSYEWVRLARISKDLLTDALKVSRIGQVKRKYSLKESNNGIKFTGMAIDNKTHLPREAITEE